MEKLKITRSPLPIGAIHGVYQKNGNRLRSRPQHNAGRVCDALIYILSGACLYVFEDGDSFVAEAGQILYLARDTVYDMTVQTSSYTFIYCDFDFLSQSLRRSALFTPERTADAEKLFRRLLVSHQVDTPSANCRCIALLYEIYSLLWTEESRTYLGTSASRRIQAAGEMVRRRYRDPSLSVAELARRCGVSEVYFRKLFQAHWGVSPSRYLLTVRLEKAREVLRSPLFSLEECAHQCGFSSASYFCRVFHREVGITPAAYRREYSEGCFEN